MFVKIGIALAIVLAVLFVVSYLIGRRPMRYEMRIVVAAAPSRVFAALTEPDQLVRWIGGLESSTALTEGGLRVGARSREVIAEHGRRIESESLVTAVERDRELRVTITGSGFEIDLQYLLSVQDGRTSIAHVETVRMQGINAVMAPWIRGALQRKLENDLERLKALVEAR